MVKKAMRLPPLDVVRVRNINKADSNPCIMALSSVLACWATAGYNTAGCQEVETALRACMDGPPAQKPHRNAINYHLTRMSKQMSGPTRRGGVKQP